MNARLIEYAPEPAGPRRISHRDAQRLATTGIIVEPEEIEVLRDGTFEYQGVPVLLYIFSPTQWRDAEIRLPRFHVCNCRTWEEMKARGRSDRYVASSRIDGLFELDVYGSTGVGEKRTERLNVCQNCLDQLKWSGFRNDLNSRDRQAHVQSFSLDEFFGHYRRSMVREKPRWTPRTAPSGSYSDDFDELSSRTRAAAGWRCQEPSCRRLLSALWQRRYLHLHHRNGVKGDNRPENLMIVCVECHAKQPGHEHMKRTKDYHDFMRLFDPQSKDLQYDLRQHPRTEGAGVDTNRATVAHPSARASRQAAGVFGHSGDLAEQTILTHVPAGKVVRRETLLREVARAMGQPFTKQLRSEINTKIARLKRRRIIGTDDDWTNVWRV